MGVYIFGAYAVVGIVLALLGLTMLWDASRLRRTPKRSSGVDDMDMPPAQGHSHVGNTYGHGAVWGGDGGGGGSGGGGGC